jgi:hypothetical protein
LGASRAAQSKPTEPQNALQMREPHLDLLFNPSKAAYDRAPPQRGRAKKHQGSPRLAWLVDTSNYFNQIMFVYFRLRISRLRPAN